MNLLFVENNFIRCPNDNHRFLLNGECSFLFVSSCYRFPLNHSDPENIHFRAVQIVSKRKSFHTSSHCHTSETSNRLSFNIAGRTVIPYHKVRESLLFSVKNRTKHFFIFLTISES